jgi:predicted metal-dependent hydrolase
MPPGCEIKKSRRARRLRLCVYRGGRVVLSVPQSVSLAEAERFLKAKSAWIERAVSRQQESAKRTIQLPLGDFKTDKKHALQFVLDKLRHWNQVYGFEFKRVTVRNQKTKWGSCSRRGSLNFNFRILYLSPELADYLVVHELCHLGEMNHSRRFWTLVSRAIPDYKTKRRQLKLVDLT